MPLVVSPEAMGAASRRTDSGGAASSAAAGMATGPIHGRARAAGGRSGPGRVAP